MGLNSNLSDIPNYVTRSLAENWTIGYNKRPISLNITGTSTNTILLGLGDGSFLSADFTASTGSTGGGVSTEIIGNTPNASGLTLSSGILNLEPASSSFGGIMTTIDQTFVGVKRFSSTGTTTKIELNRLSSGSSSSIDFTTSGITYGDTGRTDFRLRNFSNSLFIENSFNNNGTIFSIDYNGSVTLNTKSNTALYVDYKGAFGINISNNNGSNGINFQSYNYKASRNVGIYNIGSGEGLRIDNGVSATGAPFVYSKSSVERLKIQDDGLLVLLNVSGATLADGLRLANDNYTVASNGSQRPAPALRFTSNAYTTSNGPEDNEWRIWTLPVQGTTASTGELRMGFSRSGNTFTSVLHLTSDRNILIGGNITVGIGRDNGGSGNLVFGEGALRNATGGTPSGNYNIAIGSNVLGGYLTSGEQNVGIGAFNISSISTGSYNTVIGGGSGTNINTGIRNTFVGFNINGISTGSANTVIGAGNYMLGNISDNIIISDGNGNIKFHYTGSGTTQINSNLVVTGNTSANNLLSGTYVPTLSNATNITSSSAHTCTYTRVGDVVTVYGNLDFDVNANSTTTTINLSLPIPSNFTHTDDLSGLGAWTNLNNSVVLTIMADTSNDNALLNITSFLYSLGSENHRFTFSYIIK